MHSETQRARFVIWVFIFFFLTLGAGVYWFLSGEYQGQAAETINASKETVMRNTLIGYWTLDGKEIVWGDQTSAIKDVNPGTKHHGNSSNLAAGSARPGRTGQGLLFNGTSDTVSLGNVYNGVKTVSFWVKPNTTTQSLIDLNATATVDINAGTVRGNNWNTPTIYVDGVATATFPDTEWHHIAVTTATGINASAAYIGQIASSYFGGTIDDIRFYSDALTATQVADLYRASSAKEISNANHREVLTDDGLVGYWTMDGRDTKWSDTGTEVKDISGNANHGDASGLTRTSVTPGKLGQGLNFNGTSQYVNITGLSLPDWQSVSGYTISLWVKNFPDNLQGRVIFEMWNSGDNYERIRLSSDEYGPYQRLEVVTGREYSSREGYISGYEYASVNDTLEWHHLAIEANSAELTLFYNGSEVDSDTTISTYGSFTFDSMRIGGGASDYNGNASVSYAEALVDDVRIYNRKLSIIEITNLYNQGK